MENPIKMDDLGVPLFLETPRYVFFNSQAAAESTVFPSNVVVSFFWRKTCEKKFYSQPPSLNVICFSGCTTRNGPKLFKKLFTTRVW